MRPASLISSGVRGVVGRCACACANAAAAAPPPPKPPPPPPPPWPPPPPNPPAGCGAGRGLGSQGKPFSSFFQVVPPSVVLYNPLPGPPPLKPNTVRRR